MLRFETHAEYLDAIAKAIGLDGREDLSAEQDEALTLSRPNLGVILDMIETAAATVSSDVVANYSTEINGAGPEMLHGIHILAKSVVENYDGISAINLAQLILDIIHSNDKEDEEEDYASIPHPG